jgi:hypothetical protein
VCIGEDQAILYPLPTCGLARFLLALIVIPQDLDCLCTDHNRSPGKARFEGLK